MASMGILKVFLHKIISLFSLFFLVIFYSGKANFSDTLETKLCVHPGSKEKSSVNDGIFLQIFGTGYLI